MPKKYSVEKIQAIELRKEGLSYNEIASRLGIAKSTLGLWFNEHVELGHIKEQNISKNREESKGWLAKYIEERRGILSLKYENAEKEALVSYETYKNDPLFVAGLMIYAGEGDRRSRAHIRISNTEWRLHSIFIQFCIKYLNYSRDQMALQILAYNDLDKGMVEEYWKGRLGLDHLHKTHYIKGKGKSRLQFGVAMTIINDTRAKVVLLKWIDRYLEENAAIV